MPTATFAVQPSSFASFDELGCQWATDLNHAVRMAKRFAELDGAPQTIWRIASGCLAYGSGAMAWMEVGQSA
jgi:hypothetical protein